MMQFSAVSAAAQGQAADWLSVLRRYIVFVAVANVAWEFAHMPLYTIWETGSPYDLAFAALHCTGGDIFIATTSIMAALLLVGKGDWPARSYWRVAGLTTAFGVAYTMFSEWWNVSVRAAWAYRDAMPLIPFVDVGLSPVLQWLVIPLASFMWMRRGLLNSSHAAIPRP